MCSQRECPDRCIQTEERECCIQQGEMDEMFSKEQAGRKFTLLDGKRSTQRSQRRDRCSILILCTNICFPDRSIFTILNATFNL